MHWTACGRQSYRAFAIGHDGGCEARQTLERSTGSTLVCEVLQLPKDALLQVVREVQEPEGSLCCHPGLGAAGRA